MDFLYISYKILTKKRVKCIKHLSWRVYVLKLDFNCGLMFYFHDSSLQISLLVEAYTLVRTFYPKVSFISSLFLSSFCLDDNCQSKEQSQFSFPLHK